ncbi:MAG: ice-binding family protein [Gemmatimonadaceae bacterium]
MTQNLKDRIHRVLSPIRGNARALLAATLVVAFAAACDVHGISEPGTLVSITVTPNATLIVGGTQQMVAVGYDAEGRSIAISPTWSVAAGGGTVASTGMFTAGNVTGIFANTVVASVGSITGRASITVTAGPLATITVVPTPVTLAVTATQQFTAVGKDAGGNIVAFNATWSVLAGGGTINANGIFTAGGAPGTYTNTVQASHNDIKGFATVVVTTGPLASLTLTPNPDTLIVLASRQFIVVGKDASGNVLSIAAAWSVVAGGGTVDNAGVFTAGTTPGTFPNTVKATSGSMSATATVVVRTGPLATITVTPSPATLAINIAQQFVAVGRDVGGNIVPITPVWSVVAGGGAINAASGLFTAGTVPGTYTNTVRASVGLLGGFATVIVTTGPLASITVTPNPASVQTLNTQQFIAIGRDAGGNVFVMTPVWTIINGGGSINAGTGLFTAGAVAGTYTNTVQATSGTVSGTATVTVTAIAPVLATITVSPDPASLLTNATQLFTAVGRDGLGVIIPIAPVWTVVNGGGSINLGTGLFTAGAVAGTFTNTVRATVGAISGDADVIVTAVIPPPAGLLGAAILPNGIMAGQSVTCSGLGIINADISISPGSTLSGFGPCVYTGVTHLGDPTALTAQNQLTAAYVALMGMPCPAANNFGTVDYASKTLPAGVYCSPSVVNVTGNLTLDGGGDLNAVFVIQAGSALVGAANINLIGLAQAKNVYWVVGSSATLNASNWKGNVVALSSIDLKVNTTLLGRALARNGSVSLDATSNVITLP